MRKQLLSVCLLVSSVCGLIVGIGVGIQPPRVANAQAVAQPVVVPDAKTKSTTAVVLPKFGKTVHFTPRHRLRNAYPLRHVNSRKAIVIPATVLPVDSTGNATVSAPMDGNDSLGDCGEAMVAHVSNILTYGQGKPGFTQDTFDLNALETQYEQVSGGDNGLDEDEVVNQIWKVGIAGNPKAVITDAMDFDVTNVPLTQYLIDQFYAVELAWSVPTDFIQNFNTGTIWASADRPNPNNGHYVPLASVLSGTKSGVDVTGFYELWTWGSYCYVSPAFVASVQPQTFVAFSPQQFSSSTGLDSKGRHITEQATKWAAIGGNPVPASVISAFPPVGPPPVPTPVDDIVTIDFSTKTITSPTWTLGQNSNPLVLGMHFKSKVAYAPGPGWTVKVPTPAVPSKSVPLKKAA